MIAIVLGYLWTALYSPVWTYSVTTKYYLCLMVGEGNGTPLQYSYLENPMDGGAWWAAVDGVTQSRTWLKRLSSMFNGGLWYILIQWSFIFSVFETILSLCFHSICGLLLHTSWSILCSESKEMIMIFIQLWNSYILSFDFQKYP